MANVWVNKFDAPSDSGGFMGELLTGDRVEVGHPLGVRGGGRVILTSKVTDVKSVGLGDGTVMVATESGSRYIVQPVPEGWVESQGRYAPQTVETN